MTGPGTDCATFTWAFQPTRRLTSSSRSRQAWPPIGQNVEAFEKSLPTAMIMQELPTPRPTFVLKRGVYDQPDAEQPVTPDVPAFLPRLPEDYPANRLGLAAWVVSPENPLTAARRSESALETILRRWSGEDRREFWHPSRTAVASGAARLARGRTGRIGLGPAADPMADCQQRHVSANFRRAARIVRRRPGKSPAKPRPSLPPLGRNDARQRAGRQRFAESESRRRFGDAISAAGPVGRAGRRRHEDYVQVHGNDLYRRSLYVYRKRTVPHPSMATFDAPSWEICLARRSNTNTPLQSLALLNDVTYVEAARQLATRMLTEENSHDRERIALGFRLAAGREPRPQESDELLAALEEYRQAMRGDPNAAQSMIAHGESAVADRRSHRGACRPDAARRHLAQSRRNHHQELSDE